MEIAVRRIREGAGDMTLDFAVSTRFHIKLRAEPPAKTATTKKIVIWVEFANL